MLSCHAFTHRAKSYCTRTRIPAPSYTMFSPTLTCIRAHDGESQNSKIADSLSLISCRRILSCRHCRLSIVPGVVSCPARIRSYTTAMSFWRLLQKYKSLMSFWMLVRKRPLSPRPSLICCFYASCSTLLTLVVDTLFCPFFLFPSDLLLFAPVQTGSLVKITLGRAHRSAKPQTERGENI